MKTLRLMLALAAVAMVAVACENEDGGTPATTDTVSTTDTVIGDAATDAAPTDTTTTDTVTGDTTTTDDTTATDTAGDATTTTGDAPGCTAASDKEYQTKIGTAGSDEQKQYAAVAKDCTLAKGCLAKSGDDAQKQCISDCIKAGTPFSQNCANCYGAHSHCAAKKCLAQCAADPTSAACGECRKTNCDPDLAKCSAGQ